MYTSGQVSNIHPRDLPELTNEVAEELAVVSISSLEETWALRPRKLTDKTSIF